VDSQHKDATDTQIIVLAGQRMLNPKVKKIYVITRDHFAVTLSDLYNKCHHVVSMEKLIDDLTS
jgi:hypothetical protein